MAITNMSFSPDAELIPEVTIKVVGVGGGGGNAINRMVDSGLQGVEFVAMNTDSPVLKNSKATYKLNIGARLTKGKGAGGMPETGQRAAEESRDEIAAILKGTDMVFITAGMGGGTGTGGAPVVAEVARDMGILTVGVVTKPFKFEGATRMMQAETGIIALREQVDALLVIPNDRLKLISSERITLANAFAAADDVLRQGVQSITDLIQIPGMINLDFADVCTVMRNAGYAHMGVGRASGKDRAVTAAQMAIASPLLETSINGAKGIILNITAPTDVDLGEIEDAAGMISEAAHPQVNLFFGVNYDESLKDEIIITVVATGFENTPVPTDAYRFKTPARTNAFSGAATALTPEPAAAPVEELQTQKPDNGAPMDDDEFRQILDIFGEKTAALKRTLDFDRK